MFNYQVIEAKCDLGKIPKVSQIVEAGNLVILRDFSPIKEFRKHLIELSCGFGNAEGIREELYLFYDAGTIPSSSTLYALRCGIQNARTSRLLSQYFAEAIEKMGFATPVLIDGGINRLVLPSRVVDEMRRSGKLEKEDFQRERADGPTETFMPGPANVHRDFNRDHYLFQCNIWFPLHDAASNETLRIWPQLYHEPIFDMDATANNLDKIGDSLAYELRFGDAIVFHGEHMHTSPARPHGSEGWRRHTFDFRIASHSPDDNSHYRYNFLNLNNFIHKVQRSESSIVTASQDFNSDYKKRFSELGDSALFYVLALERAGSLSHSELADIFDIFRDLPFAEDRFMRLIEKALEQTAVPLVSEVFDYVIENSQRYFWLFNLGQILAEHGLHEKARMAMNRAYEAATGTAPLLRHFMPVKYVHNTTQLLPSDVASIAESFLKTPGN